MLSWWVIALIIIATLFVLRAKHVKHKYFVLGLILILLFVYTTISIVSKQNNIELNSASGVYQAMKVYMKWVMSAFINVKSLAGDAVKMNWTNINQTSELKNTKK